MRNWDSIVEQNADMVWRTVYRLVNNHADAADCFQEVFVAALDRSRKQAVRNWPALLRKIATDKGLDRLRRNRLERQRQAPSTEVDSALARQPSPQVSAERRELVAELRLALGRLPPDQAGILCLRFIEGQSYRQTAKQLGIKVNAVGVLLQRAKAGLRKELVGLFARSPEWSRVNVSRK